MNGVTNITEKIVGDARAWAQLHTEEGKTEVEQIQEQYEQEAKAASTAILADADAKCQAIDERTKSQAEMDRRKSILAAKQSVVNDAFAKALDTLVTLPDEEKVLLMVRLILKYQEEDAELIFNKHDQSGIAQVVTETVNSIYTRQQLKETFSGNFLDQIKKLTVSQPEKLKVTLSDKVGSFTGGFILKEGDIEKNCTFEVLVNAVRDDLEGDVSSILFQ